VAVVADLTRGEDELSLKPGFAVGKCHTRRPPSVHEALASAANVNEGTVQVLNSLCPRYTHRQLPAPGAERDQIFRQNPTEGPGVRAPETLTITAKKI
jgi:hypothetical protein